jgi:hypothetical protein
MNLRNVLGVIIGVTLVTALAAMQLAEAVNTRTVSDRSEAPAVISGDNIYITWWSNKTGNNEVLFRASTDGGATFGDKINLSNTTQPEPAFLLRVSLL